ncbi:endonuclease/exonuclease/phosphatase family protein [Mucilaginibacter sp. RS28]|uniref:Endonuclease/exonuclease/phosphatase family protein n=1 Tax=Mucilaginibacter straminoryzae TaxID=2932774 RepID=A0A9X1X764_9SPHI|nr:endonuclease/exonuclease/phosphatase family protein [Mucilaginibacter straminoryzae]MCJ8211405.1 endonuclease/exonuclease/phosphatase family protein [Mucilaginibacter straminoryzae]
MKAKKGLSFITKVLLFINCLLALSLLISYLAPVTDPRKIWPVAFFGLAYPPLLVVNLIFVLVWLLQKSWFALISLVCVLSGWDILNKSIGFHAARTYRQKETREAIRVMTYNVHSFKKYGDNNDSYTKHDILDIINLHQPDILGIQEFYTRYKGEFAMVDSIKNMLNASYYFDAMTYQNQRDAMGLAIFSKYPIINHGYIQLTPIKSDNQCVFIDVKRKDQIFRYYCIHLQSVGFGPEDYESLDSVQKGKTDVHSIRRMAAKLKNAFKKRADQIDILREKVKDCPYPYVIAGDFNDTPSSYSVNRLAKGMKNAFREKGSGLGRTYNGDFPNYQIDYILATPQFNVADYRVIEKKLSDHYPVYSDLLLKPSAVQTK